MNIVFIKHFCLGFMVSEIPRVSVFGYFPLFQYFEIFLILDLFKILFFFSSYLSI